MENKLNKKVPILILTVLSFLLSFLPILKWIVYTISPNHSYLTLSAVSLIVSFLLSAAFYLVWIGNIAFLEEKRKKPFGLLATFGLLIFKFFIDTIFNLVFLFEDLVEGFYDESWMIIDNISVVLDIIVMAIAIIGLLVVIIFIFVDKKKLVKTVSLIVMGILIVGTIISFILCCVSSFVFLTEFLTHSAIIEMIDMLISELSWLISVLIPIPFYLSVILYFMANKVPSFKKEEVDEVIEVREAE